MLVKDLVKALLLTDQEAVVGGANLQIASYVEEVIEVKSGFCRSPSWSDTPGVMRKVVVLNMSEETLNEDEELTL